MEKQRPDEPRDRWPRGHVAVAAEDVLALDLVPPREERLELDALGKARMLRGVSLDLDHDLFHPPVVEDRLRPGDEEDSEVQRNDDDGHPRKALHRHALVGEREDHASAPGTQLVYRPKAKSPSPERERGFLKNRESLAATAPIEGDKPGSEEEQRATWLRGLSWRKTDTVRVRKERQPLAAEESAT